MRIPNPPWQNPRHPRTSEVQKKQQEGTSTFEKHLQTWEM